MGQCYYTMYDISWELISLTCALPLCRDTTQNHKHFWGNLYFSNALETKMGADCSNIGPRLSMVCLMSALLAGTLLIGLPCA